MGEGSGDARDPRWDDYRDPARVRVQRRFRYHVRTKRYNPRGTIEREPCCFAGSGLNEDCRGAEAKSEFHHVDYSRAFYGAWVCVSCHRKLEHESLKLRPSDMRDYETAVRVRRGGWHGHVDPDVDLSDVPF